MVLERKHPIYRILSTLNVLLPLVGYNFVTSVFFQGEAGESQSVTVPFRAFTLLVAVLTILVVRQKKEPVPNFVKLIFFYWIILLLRFGYDVLMRYDLYLPFDRVIQIFLYMTCLTIIPCFALVKSYQWIDFKQLLKLCYVFSAVAVLLSFMNNESFQEAAKARLSANTALGTIGAGHMGLTNLILAFILLNKNRLNIILKGVVIFISIIAFVLMIRTGSRGPILSLIFFGGFYIFSRSKMPLWGVVLLCIGIIVTYLSIDYIIEIINNISPILKKRLFDRINQTSDRDLLYKEAMDAFLNSPVVGEKFGIYISGKIHYPHNIILEALMQLGLIGGLILILIILYTLKVSYKLINHNSNCQWIALLFLQVFSLLWVSGSISTTPAFSILSILLILIDNKKLLYNKL